MVPIRRQPNIEMVFKDSRFLSLMWDIVKSVATHYLLSFHFMCKTLG